MSLQVPRMTEYHNRTQRQQEFSRLCPSREYTVIKSPPPQHLHSKSPQSLETPPPQTWHLTIYNWYKITYQLSVVSNVLDTQTATQKTRNLLNQVIHSTDTFTPFVNGINKQLNSLKNYNMTKQIQSDMADDQPL